MHSKFWIGVGLVVLIVGVTLLGWLASGGWPGPTDRLASSMDGHVYSLRAEEGIAGDSALVSESIARQTLDTATATSNRWITREASMWIEVESVAQAVTDLRQWAMAHNGYIGSSSVVEVDGGRREGRLTLRIPERQLDATILEARSIAARVVRETSDAIDRSDHAIDLQARLRNLESAEKEMQAIMIEVRQATNNTDELLRVHQETLRLREQIERHRGQLNALEDRVALSTLTLTLSSVDGVTGPVVAGWSWSAEWASAGRILTWLLQTLGTATAYVVAVGLPMTALSAMVFWMGCRVGRLRPRSKVHDAFSA